MLQSLSCLALRWELRSIGPASERAVNRSSIARSSPNTDPSSDFLRIARTSGFFCAPAFCHTSRLRPVIRCVGAFRSILVDTDATADVHPAFQQACDLAARLGARVTLVDVIENLRSTAPNVFMRTLETHVIEARRSVLATLAQTRPDVHVESEVLRGDPAVALVQQVVRGNHDLVVRSHARDLVRGQGTERWVYNCFGHVPVQCGWSDDNALLSRPTSWQRSTPRQAVGAPRS